MSDNLLRFHLQNTPVRGEWIELSDAWVQVLGRHEMDDASQSLLGQLTAASLLLSATIKHRGSLTAQIIGDGPICLMIAECQADGAFRATAKLSEKHPMPPGGATEVNELLNPGGKARFAITIDPREEGKSAYQGIVPLEGNSISRMLERYMFRSEQIPTRLWLAADGQRATGLLLQRLPETGFDADAGRDIDAWGRMQKLAETLRAGEMLAENGETILRRLFWQEQIGAVESRSLRFECQCSRRKVSTMLQMLGADEVNAIVAEQGRVAVNCEYCNSPFVFDPVDVAGLFQPGALPGTDTRQ